MSKTGTVKFFNDMKGFGFIMQDDGGEDLFAHANNLADGQNLVEGDKVFYSEDWDDVKQKSLAVNISGGTGGAGGGGGGGKGFGKKGGKGGGGGFKGGKGFSGGMQPVRQSGAPGSKTGTVKFFNDMKGFGFIMQDDGGEDLFAHANNLADGQNLVEGDKVFYSEDWDDVKQKSLAVNISGGTGGAGGGGGGGKGFGKKGGGGGFKGGGGGFKGGKGFSGGMPPRGPSGAGGSKTGTVKFFNDMKGFGFIMQDDGGEDLFAHRNNLADGQNLVEGDQVFYSEEWDDVKQKSLAVNISGGTGGAGGGGFGGGFGGGKGFGKKGFKGY